MDTPQARVAPEGMMRRRTSTWVGLVLVVATGVAVAQQGTDGNEWRRYGGDAGHTRYAPLDQIDRNNVTQLRVAWRRPAVDGSITAKASDLSYSNNFRATPVMIDGVMYSPDAIGLVEAFDPASGKTLWVQEPFSDEPAQGLRGDSARGVASWTDGKERRLFVIRGEYLIALDIRTGKPVTAFGDNGRVLLRTGLGPRATHYSWTGAPQVCRDVVIVGAGNGAPLSDRPLKKEAPPGNVQAFDVRTGKMRWTFRPIPRPGEVGGETWENDSCRTPGMRTSGRSSARTKNRGLHICR